MGQNIYLTPQQNRTAERTNSILTDKARATMHDMTVPTQFWADALSTAIHLRNVTPTKVLNRKSSKEQWGKKTPRMDHARVFGCHAEVFVPWACRTKMDGRSRLCPFHKYTNTYRNYRFWHVKSRQMLMSGRANAHETKPVDGTSSKCSGASVLDELLDLIEDLMTKPIGNTTGQDKVTLVPVDAPDHVDPINEAVPEFQTTAPKAIWTHL